MGKPKYRDEEWLREKYWDEELSTNEIADLCGVTNVTISNWMSKHGIEKRPRNSARDKYTDKEWLQEQYIEKERSLSDIANELDINRDTPRYWMEKYGIERRDHAEMGAKANRDKYTPDKLQNKEWLQEKYVAENKTLKEIADIVDRWPNAVWRALRRFDIERRGSGPRYSEYRTYAEWGPTNPYGPEYREQREKALERDSYRCQICGMSHEEHHEKYDRDLHVHHIKPLRTFESPKEANKLDNLMTLCASCHAEWEGIPVTPEGIDN